MVAFDLVHSLQFHSYNFAKRHALSFALTTSPEAFIMQYELLQELKKTLELYNGSSNGTRKLALDAHTNAITFRDSNIVWYLS